MAKTASVTITISISGDGLTSYSFGPTDSNSSAHGPRGPENVTLSAGFNAQTTPTDATTPPRMVLIVPSSSSTNTKTLKGITGDAGPSPLGWTNQPVLCYVSSAGVWGITATAGEVVQITYF